MTFWILLAVVLVAVIAFGAVALVTRSLARTQSAAVYDIGEATEWVSDRLPDAITARLTHDDVEAILLWHLRFLRDRGVATTGWADQQARKAAYGGADVVSAEEEALDQVLADAMASEREIEAVDVVTVVETNADYLRAIGAFGASRNL